MTGAAAIDLQGHRGARGLAPENTLPGFARALEVGVHTLELDVGLTKDNAVVVHHDLRLNPDIARGPDGRWLVPPTPAIRDLTYRELQRYDVGRIRPGSDYARRFREQRKMDGVRIPTLESVFELARHARNDAVRFNIEIKISPVEPEATAGPDEMARAVLETIRAAGMEKRVIVQSFDWRPLAVIRREAPEIATACLTVQRDWLDNIGAGAAQDSPWTAGVRFRDHGSVPRMVKAFGCTIWSPSGADLDEAQVREARALGLKIIVWTVNEPADV
ncbi:MAG: glycerophosphodiester phosphodiesterase [Burkholderiales bacterium]|nr:glycerophosphodiester phosphodiesterase [Burkholderiales bacterium]